MNRRVLPICAAVVATLSFPLSALCQESNAATQTKSQTSKRHDNVATVESSAHKELKSSAMIPVKLLSMGTSLVIGTPVLIARHEAVRMNRYMDALSKEYDENNGPTPMMAASVPGQTLRAIGTVGEGILDSVLNTGEQWNEPFTKDTFGLGSLEWVD